MTTVATSRLTSPSLVTRRTLDRGIARALQQRSGAAATLRAAVRQVASEMTADGASHDAVRAMLMQAVENHPKRHLWDRMSIVTGRWRSATLTQQVLAWTE